MAGPDGRAYPEGWWRRHNWVFDHGAVFAYDVEGNELQMVFQGCGDAAGEPVTWELFERLAFDADGGIALLSRRHFGFLMEQVMEGDFGGAPPPGGIRIARFHPDGVCERLDQQDEAQVFGGLDVTAEGEVVAILPSRLEAGPEIRVYHERQPVAPEGLTILPIHDEAIRSGDSFVAFDLLRP